MNLLAVDTAGKTAAVAILRDDTLLYETQCNNGLTHSETLLPMIDTALRACGLTVNDLDVLGATNGPGSFTGAAHRAVGHQGPGAAAADSLRAGIHHGGPGLQHGRAGDGDRRPGCPPRAGVLGGL